MILLLPPFAYVGPGPGLSMTWALIALIATLIGAVLATLAWPIRILFRKLWGGSETETAEEEAPSGRDEVESESDDEEPAADETVAVDESPSENP